MLLQSVTLSMNGYMYVGERATALHCSRPILIA